MEHQLMPEGESEGDVQKSINKAVKEVTSSVIASSTSSMPSSGKSSPIGELISLSNGYRMWNKFSMMDILLKPDDEDETNVNASGPNSDQEGKSPSSHPTGSSSKKINNFGLCRVCKDKATGIHYGIRSCEGCKVSFEFSISHLNRLLSVIQPYYIRNLYLIENHYSLIFLFNCLSNYKYFYLFLSLRL